MWNLSRARMAGSALQGEFTCKPHSLFNIRLGWNLLSSFHLHTWLTSGGNQACKQKGLMDGMAGPGCSSSGWGCRACLMLYIHPAMILIIEPHPQNAGQMWYKWWWLITVSVNSISRQCTWRNRMRENNDERSRYCYTQDSTYWILRPNKPQPKCCI